MRQLLRRNHLIRPPRLTRIEYGLIENMIVSQRRIGTRKTGVVFQDVVHVELLEREECRVWRGVGDDGLFPHYACERSVEVDTIAQTLDDVGFGEVAAIAGEETVVCEGVEHGAGTADWWVLMVLKSDCRRTYNRWDRRESIHVGWLSCRTEGFRMRERQLLRGGERSVS